MNRGLKGAQAPLPTDLLLLIFLHLPAGNLLKARLVCKRWYDVISECTSVIMTHGRAQWLWGGYNYRNFIDRVRISRFGLPRELMKFLLCGKWTANTVLNIVRLREIINNIKKVHGCFWNELVDEFVIKGILTQHDVDNVSRREELVFFPWLAIAVHLRLITVEHIQKLSYYHINILFRDSYGIEQLLEGTLTIGQLTSIHIDDLRDLRSDEGRKGEVLNKVNSK